MHLRSDFVYASHQLRTPVTEAIWNLDVAQEQEDPIKKKESLHIVEVSLQSIQRLSEQLVSVSEIDQGTIALHISTVNIAGIFGEIQKELEKMAEEHKVTLSFGNILILASIETDAKLFKKIIKELVRNAINYSVSGAEVRILTVISKSSLVIEVADTGIGITEEEKPIIYTKFFRASNRPSSIPGAGLGLYLVREYIKALDGKTWFISEEGKGTSFYVSLPLK